jgi:GWxTD domain-containing protein
MRKNVFLLLAFILAFSVLVAEEKLSPEHKEWLDTVTPIITKVERDIFLKLATKEDRDKFIRFFWDQRDPRRDTKENEFYKDYMERVQFANKNFGRDSSKRGSQTERGYFYLLLGPPLERHFYTTLSQLWPMELWFYKGEEKYGLPPYFYLIFYQPQGLGEYRLYSPGIDGPEKLVIPSMMNQVLNRDSAYQVIRGINFELAGASLSYIPGETPLSKSSLSSDSVVASVRSVPERKFTNSYARSYLDYKDYIETDYSHNYIECSAMVRVFEQERQFFVHWTVEPETMNFDTMQGSYFASYELVLRLEKPDGSPLLENTEEIPLRLTPEQYKAHERQRFAFQDILPLAPGESRLFLLLKNKTAKDFVSFQARLSVPGDLKKPQLSDLLLYHTRAEIPETQKKNLRAFALDGRRYGVNARNEFLPQEKLGCYFQALRFSESPADFFQTILLEVSSLAQGAQQKIPTKPNAPVLSKKYPTVDVLNASSGGIDLGPFSLEGLAPGYYQVVVSVLDLNGHALLSRKENFVLLSIPYAVLPWVYSRQRPPFPDAEQLFFLSSQHFLAGNYPQAQTLLEQAMMLRDEPRIRLLLGRTFFAKGDFRASLAIVDPIYRTQKSRDAAKIIALDYFSLGDWASALLYCEDLLIGATEISVLNLAAECHLRLNQPEKALILLRKSLELDPAQASIKELEEKAKKSIKGS